MTKYLRPLTVGSLIELLAEMPEDAVLKDIGTSTGSYRGYYEHVYIEPSPGGLVHAALLLHELKNKLGTTMHGYKGGDYTFTEACYVFYAHEGYTGPMLVDFDGGEPIVCAETGWL